MLVSQDDNSFSHYFLLEQKLAIESVYLSKLKENISRNT